MSQISAHDPSQLLWQAREGRPDALGNLLELYRRYLLLLARMQIHRQFQRKVDPSDIVQEVYFDAVRDFPHFRGKTERELLAWLRKILACNLTDRVQRHYGAQRRDIGLEQSFGDRLARSSQSLGSALRGPFSTPSERVVRREQAVLLANAMEKLPSDYRDVLILRNLEQLSFPEVAAQMERSLGSVQKLWTRALIKLRGIMGQEDDG